mgnify:CR=1 FL=1
MQKNSSMAVFYAPDILRSPILPEEESLHCSKVLRLQVGDEVSIIDGRGGFFKARIIIPHAKRTEVEIIEKEIFEQKPFGVHIAIAPTKNMDRIEWFLEKTTEIGITEITPLLCAHSERKQINIERMFKILVSATKQSKHVFLPKLNPLTDFATLMEMYGDEAMRRKGEETMDKFIAHCYKDEKRELKDALRKGRDVLILIGPEGDFSEQEVEMAIANGFVPVGLGRSRLRTETAGVVACHTAVLLNED